MEKEIIRQGDVAVVLSGGRKPVGELKKVKKDNGRVVLAYGEVTGHAHAISGQDADLFEDEEGRLFLRTYKDVELKHEEHRRYVGNHKEGYPVIPATDEFHEVIRQREYEPGEVPRPVSD